MKGINSEDLETVEDVLSLLQNVNSLGKKHLVQEVVESGVVTRLVSLLSEDQLKTATANQKDTILLGVTKTLSEILGIVNKKEIKVIVDSGIIPALSNLLKRQFNKAINLHVIKALGRIAQVSTKFRDIVLDNGIMDGLAPLVQGADPNDTSSMILIEEFLKTLVHLCSGKPLAKWTQLSPALPLLRKILEFKNAIDDILPDFLKAINEMSENKGSLLEIFDAEIISLIVQNLHNPDPALQELSLMIFSSALSGHKEQLLNSFLDSKVLDKFDKLLNSPLGPIRELSYSLLVQFSLGESRHAKAALAPHLIVPLIETLEGKDEATILREEAARVICYASSCHLKDPDFMAELVQKGCLPALCTMLDSNDKSLVAKILESLRYFLSVKESNEETPKKKNEYAEILEAVGAWEKIRLLESSDSPSVSRAAKELMDFSTK